MHFNVKKGTFFNLKKTSDWRSEPERTGTVQTTKLQSKTKLGYLKFLQDM